MQISQILGIRDIPFIRHAVTAIRHTTRSSPSGSRRRWPGQPSITQSAAPRSSSLLDQAAAPGRRGGGKTTLLKMLIMGVEGALPFKQSRWHGYCGTLTGVIGGNVSQPFVTEEVHGRIHSVPLSRRMILAMQLPLAGKLSGARVRCRAC